MRHSLLLHPIPLTILYYLSNNLFALDIHSLFTNFPHTNLSIELTLVQILFTLFLTQLTQTPSSTPPSQTLRYSLPCLHYLATLLINLSISQIGIVPTLLFRLSQPIFTSFLTVFRFDDSFTRVSMLGSFLTFLGILHYIDTPLSFLPIFLATIICSIRDIHVGRDSTEGKHPYPLRELLLGALPIAAITCLSKAFLYGVQREPFVYLLRNSAILAVYHVSSILLLSRVDVVTHSVIATLKRFSAILLPLLVFKIPVSRNGYEGIGVAFVGFVTFLLGRRRQRLPGTTVLYTVISGIVVIAAFLVAAGFPHTGLNGFHTVFKNTTVNGFTTVFKNSTENVERVQEGRNSRRFMVIRLNDYQSAKRVLEYAGYTEAVKHDSGNVGNLVWKYAAHERLPDFGDVETCDDDVLGCVKKAREKGMEHIIYKPVANILNPDAGGGTFRQFGNMIMENRLRVMMVGMGVQFPFRLNSNDPDFNSSARITSDIGDFNISEEMKNYFVAMDDNDGVMFLRGDFATNVTRKGGFTNGYSMGCPSLWINGDKNLGKSLEKKYAELMGRQEDKSLKIAVNLKNKMDAGMTKQIVHFRDNYPNSRFYAQGPGDIRLLSSLKVPYNRTRFFGNVEDWMNDLREMDVSYGVRIHGNMIAMGVGLPVLVVASDWRVLELVQRMNVPFVTSYDRAFDDDVDVARLVARIGFDGEAFDRNRCEIGKVYTKVFGEFGFGVGGHVREISELC